MPNDKKFIQSASILKSSGEVDVTRLLDFEGDFDEFQLDIFIQKIKEYFSLENITYLCPTLPGRNLADPYLLSTYSSEWANHYKLNDYTSIDPVLLTGCRSILPIDWATLPKQTPKVKKLFGESAEFKIGRQGLTVPVRGPLNGLWALLIATSNESDQAWRDRHYELLRDIVHVAHYIHKRAYESHVKAEAIDLNTISLREKEALSWLAEGKSIEEIGIILSISPETVKGYLDSARYKLGALNKIHAIVKAIRFGLIR